MFIYNKDIFQNKLMTYSKNTQTSDFDWVYTYMVYIT